MNDKKRSGFQLLLCMLLSGFFLVTGVLPAKAQYPYTIEMSHTMIGNATIVAKLEIVHKPGFEANAGLEYEAHIDPNFAGNGTAYELPPLPGNQAVIPTPNHNYITTKTPQTIEFLPTGQNTNDQVTTDITYFDGLGRRLQDVSVMASPEQKDMIKPYSYDFAGRPDSNFIPFESANGQHGQYDANYPANQKNFIDSLFGSANKDYGFSKPLYEASPLNRILKQSAPGVAWAFNPNPYELEHVVELEYLVNETSVSGWKSVNNSFTAITYGASQLFVNVTKNENRDSHLQSVTKEYTNKTGQVVLVENTNGYVWYQTRYIYDDFGLLRCVVPPKASTPVNNPALCYYYTYDNRHRLVCKKLPGADSALMVYDKRDRLVMSQDGKMRMEDQNKWVLYCYDNLNRQLMTGIYRHSSAMSRVQMQDHYDASVINLSETFKGYYDTIWHGYTRNVVAALGNNNHYDVLTVSYYDNYGMTPIAYHFDAGNGIVPVSEKLANVRNLPTWGKVKVMGDESTMKDWILSANYYDDKYRVIQTVADNPSSNGHDVVTNKYSFAGRLEIQKTKHIAFSDTIEYTENFVYDHRGRMLEHTMEGLPNQPKVMLASLHYNRLGELAEKQTHSVWTGGNYQPFLQKTDYLYNIRGWLTSINNPDDLTTDQDIFAMRLHYNDVLDSRLGLEQYNGNISAIEWTTNRSSDRSAYMFGYDPLNRMNGAVYFSKNGTAWLHDYSFDETGMQYDENGNMLQLIRYGANSQKIDELIYNYLDGGNQIRYVTDATGDIPNVTDYPGGTATTQGFYYDANGNMIISVDKGINDSIDYSYLNKPELLDFGNGEKIRYIYDGAGNKLAKKVLAGNALPESSLIYSGNFVYNWNGVLQYILTSEGRLIPDNNSYRFEYFMKDHLGNTRATYAQAAPGLPQVSEYQHYYPFGMQMEALCYSSGADLPNNHLYNGMELQPEYGLQWYDYGARFYDAELGRWHSVDPLCEKHYNVSPYVYCLDNPVNLIDPDGRLEWPVNKTYNRNGRRHENNWHAPRPHGRLHQGVDINHTGGGNTDQGAPIVATHNGTVTRVGHAGDGDGGGNRIKITSADGTVSTSYMHLDGTSSGLKVGSEIKEGQQIGTMGRSGANGQSDYTAHLHYEVSVDGTKINPANGASHLVDPQQIIDSRTPTQQPEYSGGTLPEVTVVGQSPKAAQRPLPQIPVPEIKTPEIKPIQN